MKRCLGCMAELPPAVGEVAVCPACGYVQGTTPREAYHLQPGTTLRGRYLAGRVLGYGGFGVTYVGWDERLSRRVAIKEYLPSTFATRMPGATAVTVYNGEATEQFGAGLGRFIEEARRLARFNGIPGIVDIYDTFAENGTAYIVMEFLQGRDVKDMLASSGPMPYDYALGVVLKICDTLAPVHAEGVIHRDISPDNIYITDAGEVKLLDFGASRYATSVNSKSLSVILKSGYAPEEQYRSRGNQGPWSDVYALAATFYKMLTGETPPDSMERAIKDELAEPSKLGVQLPKAAENAIMNALNVKKADRTQTAAEFKAALTADATRRVKGKTAKSDAGATPAWLKGLLGGGVAALLAFGVLTLTGVIDFGQGNVLRDTFGSAVPEGHVNAPGIVNLQEADAKTQVQKAGLDYLITGTDYDDQIEKGRILSQTPPAGQVVELESLIEVTISGGSLEDARAAGDAVLPDLTYKPVWDAERLVAETPGYYNHSSTFEYSDDVADGLIIRAEEMGDGNATGIRLVVSAGRNQVAGGGKSTYGEIRGAHLSIRGSRAQLYYAVAGSNYKDGESELIEIDYLASPDGGETWYSVNSKDDVFTRSAIGYNWGDMDERPVGQYKELGSLLAMYYPELAGQELTLGFRRQHGIVGGGPSSDPSPEGTVDFTQLEQTFTFTLEDAPAITGSEIVPWEDIQAMVDAGGLPDRTELGIQATQYAEGNSREEDVALRLTGSFRDITYDAYCGYQNTYTHTGGDGTLYMYAYLREEDRDPYGVTLVGEVESATDANGHTTATLTRPGYAAFGEEGNLPGLAGASTEEAVIALLPYTKIGKEEGWNSIDSAFGFIPMGSDTVPVGEVMGYQISPGSYSISIYVSIGPDAMAPQVLHLYDYQCTGEDGDTPYAVVMFGLYTGLGGGQIGTDTYTSTDGGATWPDDTGGGNGFDTDTSRICTMRSFPQAEGGPAKQKCQLYGRNEGDDRDTVLAELVVDVKMADEVTLASEN